MAAAAEAETNTSSSLSSSSLPLLSDEQQEIVQHVIAGRNVFFTGPAGTGKSFVIKTLQNELRQMGRRAVFTACTGAAAVLIGGSTIHRVAGMNPTLSSPDLSPVDAFNIIRAKKPVINKLAKAWSEIDMLFIDEISMMDASFMNKLEYFARRFTRKTDAPWGGVQVVLSGDFLQLPPVSSPEMAFMSDAWQMLNLKVVQLTHVFRQNGDDAFLSLLHNVRVGQVDAFMLETIRQTRCRPMDVDGEVGIVPTNLFAKNVDVDRINEFHLDQIKDHPVVTFTAIDKGTEQALLKNLQAAPEIHLKQGAQVMLLVNLDVEAGLANGTRGVVMEIVHNVPVVRFTNGVTMHVEPFTWTFEDTTKPHKKVVLAQRTQTPLRLAWAITVHKSQGMTLDAVRIDCDGIHTCGQFYVALSRARSLRAVEITNFQSSCVQVSEQALAFYNALGRA